MTGVSHAIIGFSSGLIVASLSGSSDPHTFILVPVVGALASLVPDLDTDISTATIFTKNRIKGFWANRAFNRRQRNRFPEVFFYIGLYFIEMVIGAILSLLHTALKNFSRHRGISHSLIGCGAFFLVIILLSIILKIDLIYSIAAFAGYLSHIIADNL